MQEPKSKWMYSSDEERWFGNCATRDDAIEEGRDYFDPDAPYYVAMCTPVKLPESLFHDMGDFLNDRLDDEHSFEDCFTEETRLTAAEESDLEAAVNKAWQDWADRVGLHDRVNSLSVSKLEVITPTPSE